MRDEFFRLGSEYPRHPPWRDSAFRGSPLKDLLCSQLPAAVSAAIPESQQRYIIEGSIGKGGWTHTPWVVLLDPAVTTTVEDGYYVVYLMNYGASRLYLTLNQGCTATKEAAGIPAARNTLRQRADVMWSRVRPHADRLTRIEMDLNVTPRVWRGKLYELGVIAGRSYDLATLPAEAEMQADLRECLRLYDFLKHRGGWTPDEVILREAEEDRTGTQTLEQAKVYRQHRSIERQSSHSKAVKRRQGTRCRGCDFEMFEIYGKQAKGMIDAHHLSPLSQLEEGETVSFDPLTDFAVLCPNCHRAIHRMADPSDIAALRAAVAAGKLRA